MNKVYRVIWSKAHNTWVAVSEITKAHGKNNHSSVSATEAVSADGGIEQKSTYGSTDRSSVALGVSLAATFVVASLGISSASANTVAWNSSGKFTDCSGLAAGTGNDGIARAASKEAIDGSGLYSMVGGCNANGGGFQGVTLWGAYAVASGQYATAMGIGSAANAFGLAQGANANASGTNSIAIGAGGTACGWW